MTSSGWSATSEAVNETRGLQISKTGMQLLEVLRAISLLVLGGSSHKAKKEHPWPQSGYKRQRTMARDNLLSHRKKQACRNATQKATALFCLCKLTGIRPVYSSCNLLICGYLYLWGSQRSIKLTWEFGSLLLCADKKATAMKYSGHSK